MSIRLFFSIFLSMIALNVAAQGRELPDFTDLVDKHGSAVVNVSTTQTIRGNRTLPQFPELDEDDPMFEFFKRFIPRQPGMPRDFQSKSLGSGFIIDPAGKVVYNGAIDSRSETANVNYVDAALTALAAGKSPDPSTTKPVGCSVKY